MCVSIVPWVWKLDKRWYRISGYGECRVLSRLDTKQLAYLMYLVFVSIAWVS